MRIAQIGCTANPKIGGMGRALFNHAKVLSEAGHDVAVYTLSPLPEHAPFLIYTIDSLFHAGKAAWGAKFNPSLKNFNIIHLHLPFFGVVDTVTERKKRHRRADLLFARTAKGDKTMGRSS